MTKRTCYSIILESDNDPKHGEMSERFKELVLKTSDSFIWAVGSNPTLSATQYGEVPKGLRGQFAKLLGRVSGARVRSPSSPPKIDRFRPVDFLSIAKAMVYHHAESVNIIKGGIVALVSHHTGGVHPKILSQ